MSTRSGGILGKRARPVGAALSVAAHLGVLLALMSAWRYQPRPPEPVPMDVSLIQAPQPAPVPEPPKAAAAPDKPPPKRNLFRPTPAPPDISPLPTQDAPVAVAELGEGDIAGAGTAESGGGGGACNMVRLVENGLRKDRLVQSAVADAHRASAAPGKAILVWNGDWVRNLSQDGKGLAAVREAILGEVGFAPAACRSQPVHGLVVLSLTDAPGFPRLAIGGGDWRWSDLLKLHSEARAGS